MGLVVKALVLALLTLPVMAYVTGSMVGARSELPAQREPVVIGDRMDVAPQQTIRPEAPRRDDDQDDRDDDPDDRDDDSEDTDDTDVSVVRPQPREIDDDADDRDDGPDDDTGDSGDDSGDDDD